jgi:hypothetical protein
MRTNLDSCLVHAYCKLSDEEIMLAKDNISQPVPMSDISSFYPERWLAGGEAYEFTSRPTEAPPAELLDEFKRLTDSVRVLGLYYAGEEDHAIQLEWTEGRKNITRQLTDIDRLTDCTETAWRFGADHHSVSAAMVCVKCCDSRITRSAAAVHKGTKSHVKQEGVTER